jgi:hypothetical protein
MNKFLLYGVALCDTLEKIIDMDAISTHQIAFVLMAPSINISFFKIINSSNTILIPMIR